MTMPAGSDWRVEHHARVESTQTMARGRPAWSAVVAQEQTVGRGQAERTFQSNPGGLYLTAVLPYAGDPLASRGFALAVGWAACEMLRGLGVENIRLRWPNDLMVGARKVGGILVEQGGADTLLVGVGLNVANRPWCVEPALEAIAGRLVDAVQGGTLPDHAKMVKLVLRGVQTAYDVFALRRLAGFVPILNATWGEPRAVEIEPAAGVPLQWVRGRFCGIDAGGALVVETASGERQAIPAHHVGRLRELD